MEDLPHLENLDAWLAERESRVVGIKPDAAATVVWADPRRKVRTPLSIVYLHGYTATKGETRPVPDRVAAALRANLYFLRLTGHGVGPEGHHRVTMGDWIDDVREALAIGRLLGERVVVIATSTGATLLSWLTLKLGAKPDATVFISPNFALRHPGFRLLRWPGKSVLLKLMVGSLRTVEPINELHDRIWDLRHHTHSFLPMMKLVSQVGRLDFGAWPTPLLAVFNPDDDVVDPSMTLRLLSRMPQGKLQLERWEPKPGENSHVLAGEALAPGSTDKLTELSLRFLRKALDL